MEKSTINYAADNIHTLGMRSLENGEDFGEMLKFYGLEYVQADYYYEVGEISKVQGWILHISVVISQVEAMMRTVIPILIQKAVPFKIAIDKETCNNLLNGFLGTAQIGKLISIYPSDDQMALSIAKVLIEATKQFKGPFIPTDICLGNVVFTRYGGIRHIIGLDEMGREEKCIYNSEGKLVKDVYNIPFKLPAGVYWPFSELASHIIPTPQNLLKNKYKLLSILKNDVRGNVFKGIYAKGFFRPVKCVIKQGFKNMSSEDTDRCMHDRLTWQFELYNELADFIPMPKILDLFIEEGNTYLIIEFINGSSLYERKNQINPESNNWPELSVDQSVNILNYIIKICAILEVLHQKGYVHRDLAPGNFMVDKKDNIYLIDLELAYSILKKKPNPPFQYGTAGFISPEQKAVLTPTPKEDIYGLGAMMIIMLTGLSPVRLNTADSDNLFKNLTFFIEEKEIVQLICSCLNWDPLLRPELSDVRKILTSYKNNIESSQSRKQCEKLKLSDFERKEIIYSALVGLTKPPVIVFEDLWYSKITKEKNFDTPQNKEYSKYPGIYEGISGVLYLLGRVRRAGLSIEACEKNYKKGLQFLEENIINSLTEISAGLYNGTAGVALALLEGLSSGLIEDNMFNRLKIRKLLELPLTGLVLSAGVAGKGISILLCERYLDETVSEPLLKQVTNNILSFQEKDGSWSILTNTQDNIKSMSFGSGITGIIWFLLDYINRHPNTRVEEAALKALNWVLEKTNHLKDLFNHKVFQKKVLNGAQIGDERKGILLTFIKAYEVFKNPYYKRIVEEQLIKYPSCPVRYDFSQNTGLAGLGELYLEAWRVFTNTEWQDRANWISDFFIHSFFKTSENSGYWKMEENNYPTADFMIGNSGIIHFLLRCLNPYKIGYRLLT